MHGKLSLWLALFLFALLSGCRGDGDGNAGANPPPGPVLQSLSITPTDQSIIAGNSLQFTATGTYSDGSERDLGTTVTWTTASSIVATVHANGLVLGTSPGTTTLEVRSGTLSASTQLTITLASSEPPEPLNPVLQSISVTPASSSILMGSSQQFTATGIYSDGSAMDITAAVTWVSESSAVATITSPGGVATARATGSSSIRAMLASVSGTTSLTVTGSILPVPIGPSNPPAPTPAINWSFSISTPLSGAPVGDVFQVSVAIRAPVEIAAVTVQAAGRSANLTFFPAANRTCTLDIRLSCWIGELNVTGLPRGSFELTIVASDAQGYSEYVTQPLLRDDQPTINVSTPTALMVAQHAVRISATCLDDSASGCASLVAFVCSRDTTSVCTAPQVNGIASLHGDLDIQLFEGRPASVVLRATDDIGQESTVSIPIFVDTNPHLRMVTEVPGTIWDADAGRILFLDNDNQLQIRDRLSNIDTAISATVTRLPTHGFLTPTGAAFVERSSTNRHFAKSWEAGSVVDLGSIDSSLSLRGKGAFVIWSNQSVLSRRNVSTQTSAIVSSNAGNTENDVTVDGTVGFWSTDYQIGLYAPDDTTRWLTNDAPSWNIYPLTDGSDFVYIKLAPPSVSSERQLILLRNGFELELVPRSARDQQGNVPRLDNTYRITAGWVAFGRPGPSGVDQIWRVSPNSVATQITFSSSSSRVERITADGTLVFITSLRRYRILANDTAPTDIGSNLGKTIMIDDVLHTAIGSALLEVRP